MKSLTFGLALLLLSPFEAIAEQQTVILTIDKMTCALCPITVTRAIEQVEGVSYVAVDYDTKRARVRYDDAVTSLERITEASTNAGYPAHRAE